MVAAYERRCVYSTSELAVVMTHSDHSREVHMFKFITGGELDIEVLVSNSQLAT